MSIKSYTPRGLFSRTILIFVIPAILVQLVTTFVFYNRHWETIARRLTSNLAGDIVFIANEIDGTENKSERERFMTLARQHLLLDVILSPGVKIIPSLPGEFQRLEDGLLFAELDQRLRRDFQLDLKGDENYIIVKIQLHDSALTIAANRKRLFSVTTDLVIFWMVASSILLFGIAALFMRNQIRPIRKLAEAAEKLGKGQEVSDLKPSGAREVRQATFAFRIMRDRIRRQIQQRTDMLSGISHDLRTPLTRLRLELAMLQKSPAIEGMQADLDEMEKMIESYLAFAKGDHGEEPQVVQLQPLVEDAAQSVKHMGTPIKLHPLPDTELLLRADAMRRCLGNLIGNACRYGKKVEISGVRQNQAVEIRIEDDGPGIPANQREEVFKPFRRLEESRNSETGGIGLGLTIARDIARGHGGDVMLSQSPLGGLRATLRLPL